MSNPWTVDDVLRTTPSQRRQELSVPHYVPGKSSASKVALAVESMKRHTSDEGWQLMAGLESAGYIVHGYGICNGNLVNQTNVSAILKLEEPGIVVVQDKREWIGRTAGSGFDERERFVNVGELAKRSDVFKVTILKDAHNDHALQTEAAEEMVIHAWIVYYHSRIVKHLAPYVRERHLIRTYHSVDKGVVPKFVSGKIRHKALLSGAISKAYPLRLKLREARLADYLLHPGYGRLQCFTEEYLHTLSKYKVAICTSSVYGYAVRKIVEASACGCRVITDLPADDVLPCIDSNLIRVRPDVSLKEFSDILDEACQTFDDDEQAEAAEAAKYYYDYRRLGRQMMVDIETLRRNYS